MSRTLMISVSRGRGNGRVGSECGAERGAICSLPFRMGFRARLQPRRLFAAGELYGLAAFVLSSFVLLPLPASVTGTGTTISHMARIVGWGSFGGEHLIFGLARHLVRTRRVPGTWAGG
jgi:hypothetical protein